MSGKVYVGVSAGSIIITPNISIAEVEPADPNNVGLTNLTGLNIVDFEVSPHVPEMVSYENVEIYSKTTKNKIYAIDHNSAVLVRDAKIEMVGNVVSKIYN
jgi:dipeptidase E